MGFERIIVSVIRSQLVIAIPFTLLFLRLFVRWVAREDAKEIVSGLLAIPLDLVFISISLVLSGLARISTQFERRYGSDTDLIGGFLILILFAVATLITLASRF